MRDLIENLERHLNEGKNAVHGLKVGDVFHFVGGNNYGQQGKVMGFDLRGGMVPSIDWENEKGQKVSSLVGRTEVKKGKAPSDMPWKHVYQGRKDVFFRRLKGKVYKVWEGTRYQWRIEGPGDWSWAKFANPTDAKKAVDER